MYSFHLLKGKQRGDLVEENKNIKVLIIDDEEDILYTIKEICTYCGYEAITTQSGKEGYHLCRKEKPNLIIIDYHMPNWDGLTTIKKIKELDEAVAILVLTVDERQEISDKFMEVGATDFAIKPIKAPDLIARMKVNLKINKIQQKMIEERESMFVDKGISPATLSVILDYLKEREEDVTIDDITNGVNLAYQTVHRYLQYLLEEDKLEILPTYGKIGRPKNKYRLLK